MIQLRLPRLAGAAAAALAVGVLVSGGWNITKADPDENAVAEAGNGSGLPSGGGSPSDPTPGATGDEEPTPTAPTLTPLPRPDKAYATPAMPKEPGKDASELERIEYKLETVAWTAAGQVYADDTTTECSVSEDDLIEVGSQKFTCNVRFADISTPFQVTAKTSETSVEWSWVVKQLPVTEEKAVHEITRVGFKPARVTCDLVDVELVEVDAGDGVTCWVTTTENTQITYNGTLAADGQLDFHRVGKPR